jgi:hypothetical protein
VKQRRLLLTGRIERFLTGMNIPTIERRIHFLKKAKNRAKDPWFKDYWQKVIEHMEKLKHQKMH